MKKFVICLLILAGASPGAANAAEVLIVANKNVPDTALSRKSVEKIFLGKLRRWTDNSAVHAAAPADPDLLEIFLKRYLRKPPSKYKTYWRMMIFSGKGIPPKSMPTEAELLDYVARTPGAVGFVSDAALSQEPSPSVQIIKVQ